MFNIWSQLSQSALSIQASFNSNRKKIHYIRLVQYVWVEFYLHSTKSQQRKPTERCWCQWGGRTPSNTTELRQQREGEERVSDALNKSVDEIWNVRASFQLSDSSGQKIAEIVKAVCLQEAPVLKLPVCWVFSLRALKAKNKARRRRPAQTRVLLSLHAHSFNTSGKRVSGFCPAVAVMRRICVQQQVTKVQLHRHRWCCHYCSRAESLFMWSFVVSDEDLDQLNDHWSVITDLMDESVCEECVFTGSSFSVWTDLIF